jgi:MFS family permease
MVGTTVTEQRIQRSLRLFYAFRLLATSYLYVPIFMLFQASRGLSFFERLALGGIFSAVIILVEIPTGVFADRIGRRRSMLIGALTMVASCLIAARAHNFATFALAESLGAISIAMCSGADSAYLFDFLREHDRAHEYSRHESTASAWHLMGSAVAFAGGGLLAQVDLALPYLVTAGVASIAAVIACVLHDDRPLGGERVPAPSRRALDVVRSWGAQMRDALAEVGRNPRLGWMVGYSAVVFVLLRTSVYIYQPYLQERGLGPVASGGLFAAVYIVASAVAYRTYRLRRRFGDETLLWSLLAVLAVSFIGLAGAGNGPWMFSLLVIQAVANGLYSPLTKPLLNAEITDSRGRAAILSVESMARRAAMGIFAPLVGLWGEADVMLMCGAVGVFGLVLLAFARVRVRPASIADEG